MKGDGQILAVLWAYVQVVECPCYAWHIYNHRVVSIHLHLLWGVVLRPWVYALKVLLYGVSDSQRYDPLAIIQLPLELPQNLLDAHFRGTSKLIYNLHSLGSFSTQYASGNPNLPHSGSILSQGIVMAASADKCDTGSSGSVPPPPSTGSVPM